MAQRQRVLGVQLHPGVTGHRSCQTVHHGPAPPEDMPQAPTMLQVCSNRQWPYHGMIWAHFSTAPDATHCEINVVGWGGELNREIVSCQ